ncbi:hypothetical protein ES703_73841 [subsurface metagenome]
MLKILGAVLILGDIYWVYWLGLGDAFDNFAIALAIVAVAALGGFLLTK